MQKRLFSTNFEFYKKILNENNVKLVIAIGPAGTGKTMGACQEAIKQLKEGNIKKIVITRPIIGADNDIGFLPGKLEDKMAPWTRPILDVFYDYYTKSKIEQFIKNDIIEISPLIYMRGRTFKNAFIIGDEMQNTNINQMKMLLTRIGDNSKMVITGDLAQKDIIIKNGLDHFLNLIKNNNSDMIGIIHMNNNDIKRSEIVQTIINIYQ
jgi:phosphate starvation-inducible PhoH-like protein